MDKIVVSTMAEPIGKQIALLRKKKGLTQKELAEAIGLKTLSISQIEIGRKEPSSKVLKDIADILGYNVSLKLVEKRRGLKKEEE